MHKCRNAIRATIIKQCYVQTYINTIQKCILRGIKIRSTVSYPVSNPVSNSRFHTHPQQWRRPVSYPVSYPVSIMVSYPVSYPVSYRTVASCGFIIIPLNKFTANCQYEVYHITFTGTLLPFPSSRRVNSIIWSKNALISGILCQWSFGLRPCTAIHSSSGNASWQIQTCSCRNATMYIQKCRNA